MENVEHNPPRMFGAFARVASLGIDRAGYIALQADDPAAAAAFAVKHMGFYLVHVDGAGRHYLAAHGLDPYSLVYVPGKKGEVDHLSFIVMDAGDLGPAAEALEDLGVAVERIDVSDMWRHGPAVRFRNTSGQLIELTPGVQTDAPMAALVAPPTAVPAPISLDHFAIRVTDVPAAFDFAQRMLGLKESARIVPPDGIPALGFFRCHTLFHCYTVVRSPNDGLHHVQFTLKNPEAIHAAAERLKSSDEVKVIWGPLRHGPGHNLVVYFLDYTGNIIEYSAEEEIILNDANYVPRAWSVMDPLALDEWHRTSLPPEMM